MTSPHHEGSNFASRQWVATRQFPGDLSCLTIVLFLGQLPSARWYNFQIGSRLLAGACPRRRRAESVVTINLQRGVASHRLIYSFIRLFIYFVVAIVLSASWHWQNRKRETQSKLLNTLLRFLWIIYFWPQSSRRSVKMNDWIKCIADTRHQGNSQQVENYRNVNNCCTRWCVKKVWHAGERENKWNKVWLLKL